MTAFAFFVLAFGWVLHLINDARPERNDFIETISNNCYVAGAFLFIVDGTILLWRYAP
jgi:hypothetical protein